MRLLALLLLPLLFTSCPPDLEVAPAFVTVAGFELTTRPEQGAATTDITEVWAFRGEGEFLGVFPLPARIPVASVGPTDLRFEAGIRQDGRSVTPDIYPFYTAVSRRLDLVSGETTALGILDIAYRDNTVFGFVEGFEDDGRVFTVRVAGDTGIVRQAEVVRSGGDAGAIFLDEQNPLAELASDSFFPGLNVPPINVWLEVDYRSDAPAVFGVIGQQNGFPVRVFDPGFLPRGEWTKIYFNLSPIVGTANLSEFRVALSTLLNNEADAGTVYLDNMKLLYFRP
jgi:hypothetical protein